MSCDCRIVIPGSHGAEMKYNPYLQTIRGIERWASAACKREEKRRRHRDFRRQAKRGIWRELHGDDGISQHVIIAGEWLM